MTNIDTSDIKLAKAQKNQQYSMQGHMRLKSHHPIKNGMLCVECYHKHTKGRRKSGALSNPRLPFHSPL